MSTVYIEVPVSEELPTENTKVHAVGIREFKSSTPIITAWYEKGNWYTTQAHEDEIVVVTHWLKPVPLESLTADKDAEIQRLRDALKDILDYSQGHHNEQNSNIIIHSLLVDIPHQCQSALYPKKEGDNKLCDCIDSNPNVTICTKCGGFTLPF